MKTEFRISKRWNEAVAELDADQRDLYFSEEYYSLYEGFAGEAECFIAREGKKLFLFPYLRKKIQGYEGLFDFETAYGYGGPLSNSLDSEFLRRAESSFFETCRNTGLVAGFVRFCPWLANHKLIQNQELIEFDRKTVVMDLTNTEDHIWSKQIHSKHRNVIRKAERADMRFAADESFSQMDIFISLYQETMRKVGAEDFYFFSNNYFDKLRKNFYGKAFLGLVYSADIPVAGAIFLYDKPYGHYHLSGSRAEYQAFAPNNLLIYKAALYLKERGIKVLHLGGGDDPDGQNTLFKFKKRFSPVLKYFYVGRFIFDSGRYRDICAAWELAHPEKVDKFGNRLLRYRC
jgi:serine/alanine adding enzyme